MGFLVPGSGIAIKGKDMRNGGRGYERRFYSHMQYGEGG